MPGWPCGGSPKPHTDRPAHEQAAVHVAFLVAADQEPGLERAVEDLAREWAGRIDVELLGPMAAYNFTLGRTPRSTAASPQ